MKTRDSCQKETFFFAQADGSRTTTRRKTTRKNKSLVINPSVCSRSRSGREFLTCSSAGQGRRWSGDITLWGRKRGAQNRVNIRAEGRRSRRPGNRKAQSSGFKYFSLHYRTKSNESLSTTLLYGYTSRLLFPSFYTIAPTPPSNSDSSSFHALSFFQILFSLFFFSLFFFCCLNSRPARTKFGYAGRQPKRKTFRDSAAQEVPQLERFTKWNDSVLEHAKEVFTLISLVSFFLTTNRRGGNFRLADLSSLVTRGFDTALQFRCV